MSYLEESFERLGKELVNCYEQCKGIDRDLSAGILPRCLTFEEKGRKGNRGSVVVGLNPGIPKRDEKEHCQEKQSYETWRQFWDEKLKGYRFFKHLLSLVNQVNLNGPILWTDLAKCGTKKKERRRHKAITG